MKKNKNFHLSSFVLIIEIAETQIKYKSVNK